MQTRTEVRPGEDGTFWLWEIHSSDVPGEGGGFRREQVNDVTATAHELACRQLVKEAESLLADRREKLEHAMDIKAKVLAAAQAAEGG